MFESDKKSPLDRAKKSLYSRTEVQTDASRHDIHGQNSTVSETWSEEALNENPMAHPHNFRKLYKMVFISTSIFFVVALGIGAYTILGGNNFVSVDNVDISIEGPTSIAGGETLSLNVSVVNKNNIDMQLVDLVAKYPAGTKDPSNPTKDLNQVRISLGTIESQQIAQKTLDSLLFGEEGASRDITFTAEYRTADSNAVFYKEKTYHVSVSSSPVLVSIDALDKVLSNEPSNVKVTVASNATTPIKNLLLSLDYPFGFTVISSDPAITYGNNIWRIGDLAPGAKKTFTIKSSIQGEDGEEKAIHANVGIANASNDREIATTIISRDHTFVLERPFLGLNIALEGNSGGDLTTSSGKNVHGDVIWTNNSTSKITNAKIVAQLSGNVLDKNSIQVSDGGYYDSIKNTITWEAGRTNGLDSIAPGANDRAGFSFSALSSVSGQSVSNPIITITVTASGNGIDDSGAAQDITTGVSRSVKLVSNLGLSSRALRTQGPITNSGPIPPKVDQASTYTVVWTVTNTSNIITGAVVKATIPPYVKWTGVTSPDGQNISYDPNGGVITWVVGEVPRNADVGSGAKQVAFQLSLTPSANLVGTVPQLISQASITGTDVFTGANITNNAQALSTRTSTDLLFKQGDEVVKP